MMRDSQKYFYAIDLDCRNYDLVRDGEKAAIRQYDVKEAENDGT